MPDGIVREILHCDMNNFYASVECMLNPELKNMPIAVCGSQEERHGIVLAKNYQAKACGVQTGWAIWQAKRSCPGLVIVNPHYGEYLKMSHRARQIYESYTDQVESYGMDENWLDVTGSVRMFGSGKTIANQIRERIKAELGLTISVGVSFNKIFAKLGSDMKKPDAVTCIPHDSFKEVIWHLPVSDMLGIGRSAMKILKLYGINTIGELAQAPDDLLSFKFGINGSRMKRFANGDDRSEVVTSEFHYPVKSVGNGTTFICDLTEKSEIFPMLLAISDTVATRLRAVNMRAKGIALTVKCPDLSWKEWQCRLASPTNNEMDIAVRAYELFEVNYPWIKPVRALYVRAISLCDESEVYQLTFFNDFICAEKNESIDKTIDIIRNRFGKNTIQRASTMGLDKLPKPHEDVELIMPTGMLTL